MMELWGTRMEWVTGRPLFVGRPEVRGQGLEQLLQRVYDTGERFSASERPVYLPRNGEMRLAYIDFVSHPNQLWQGLRQCPEALFAFFNLFTGKHFIGNLDYNDHYAIV